ncbi:glycosyltransferase family 4 protein [Candidatus Peregrinibacteria bacterium]|nr:glycosyltransferase family 4 protein [Candidatus Peregrinibacteria bacterium]
MKTLAKARILVTRFPFESRFGGEEVHTLSLMEGLRERGFEVFFLGACPVLSDEFAKRDFETQYVWLGKPPVNFAWLIFFTLMSPPLFFWAGILLWRAKKKWSVDTLYCLSLGEKLLMTPWARIFKMKVLWLEHARIGNWLTRNPWRVFYSILSRWAKVVVTSNAMLRFLPFVKNIQAINCGVFLEKEWALPTEVEKFLEDGKGSLRLLFVARLTADKGVDIMDRIVHSQPDIKLIVVGEGPFKFRENPRLKVLSNLKRGQLTTLYKSVDLLVLPSTEFDPFGMVAAEAMTAGTPCLISDKCGISFDLKNEREAIIRKPTFKEFDLTLKKLKRNPELLKKVARAGENFAKKNYTLTRMVDEFDYLLSPVD